MSTTGAVSISEKVADDNDKLVAEVVGKLGDKFDGSPVDIEAEFTPINIQLFQGHATDRIIVFRPKKGASFFGCIRVLAQDRDEQLWDKLQSVGVYAGLVPAGCSFEAMHVEVKIIRRKSD